MHNENVESGDRSDDVRTGIAAADDTGMVAEQQSLHVVGDAESGGESESENFDVERA